MYEVYIKDCIGEQGLYHITDKDSAIALKEELENHPDIYGVRIRRAKIRSK